MAKHDSPQEDSPIKRDNPTDVNYSDSQLTLAARLYYVDGVLQSQIAKLVGVSQAKVSRMLAVARERGIVRITVPEYKPRNGTIENKLRKNLGLKKAIVIRCEQGLSAAARRHALGYFAAEEAGRWIGTSRNVAISGGRTIEALANCMPSPSNTVTSTIIQAMGTIAATPGSYDASEIGRSLSQKFNASYLALSSPAYLPTKKTCQELLRLEEIRMVLTQLAKADLALVGVGDLGNSVFIERKILKEKDLKALRAAGAVGEVLGRFFDSNGKECKTPFQDRVVSLSLEKIRRIPEVVAIVVGEDRSEALRCAIKGKLVKSLVTDELTAQSLISA